MANWTRIHNTKYLKMWRNKHNKQVVSVSFEPVLQNWMFRVVSKGKVIKKEFSSVFSGAKRAAESYMNAHK